MTELSLYFRRLSYPYLATDSVKLAKKFLLVLRRWHHNYRTRKQLSELSAHLLDDIGIDEISASEQADKPFWKD